MDAQLQLLLVHPKHTHEHVSQHSAASHGDTHSSIGAMRGAKAGVQPPRLCSQHSASSIPSADAAAPASYTRPLQERPADSLGR